MGSVETQSSFESAISSPDGDHCLPSNAVISQDEFKRIQESMISLRTENYAFVEEKKRLINEVDRLKTLHKGVEEELSKCNKTLSKCKNVKTVECQEDELGGLRLKLQTQEEEFRLQQATLMGELNKVIRHSDNIELELKTLNKSSDNEQIHEQTSSTSSELQMKVDAYEKDMRDLLERETKLKETLANSKHELQNMNEKYRKKQESFVQLNSEKEKQYEEYKKSLDSVVNKKDDEKNELLEKMKDMKLRMDNLNYKAQNWQAERNSLEETVNNCRADRSEAQQNNESLQIQLQETHSANDCLSSQIENSKRDVLNMQQERDIAVKAAEERKELVTEMEKHMEDEKIDAKLRIEQLKEQLDTQIQILTTQLHESKSQISSMEGASEELREKEELLSDLEAQLNEIRDQLHSQKEEKQKLSNEFDEKIKEHEIAVETLENNLKGEVAVYEQNVNELTQKMTNLQDELKQANATIAQHKLDSEEEVKLVEKKHGAFIKDLKRLVNVEKKRADKLHDTLQEINNARGSSPSSNSGFEEVKANELMHVPKRVHNDSGSVSSWTMLGSQREESACASVVESDNVLLVAQVAHLQKVKCDLEERVAFLQHNNDTLASQLDDKTTIIHQYVKDKPTPDIRDTNKSLQVMLEETLIKNMHLQKDLEIMSDELGNIRS